MLSRSQEQITVIVDGTPVPKQGYLYGGRKPRVHPRQKEWMNKVADACEAELRRLGQPPPAFLGYLAVQIDFYLPTNRRVDLDNLLKGTLDGCNHLLWNDDSDIKHMMASKHKTKEPDGFATITAQVARPWMEEADDWFWNPNDGSGVGLPSTLESKTPDLTPKGE